MSISFLPSHCCSKPHNSRAVGMRRAHAYRTVRTIFELSKPQLSRSRLAPGATSVGIPAANCGYIVLRSSQSSDMCSLPACSSLKQQFVPLLVIFFNGCVCPEPVLAIDRIHLHTGSVQEERLRFVRTRGSEVAALRRRVLEGQDVGECHVSNVDDEEPL